MVQELHIDVIQPGAELVLSGRLDSRAAEVARATLHDAVDAGTGDLLLHVADLEIWDPSGLGVLVGLQRRARRTGRRLVLTEVPARERRLLRATRLSRGLAIDPTAVA
ncbi:MAG: STAS domain-containing protein [Kineosporiaceae bacterium]|jgi:anti-sigma B factor antagonist